MHFKQLTKQNDSELIKSVLAKSLERETKEIYETLRFKRIIQRKEPFPPPKKKSKGKKENGEKVCCSCLLINKKFSEIHLLSLL